MALDLGVPHRTHAPPGPLSKCLPGSGLPVALTLVRPHGSLVVLERVYTPGVLKHHFWGPWGFILAAPLP